MFSSEKESARRMTGTWDGSVLRIALKAREQQTPVGKRCKWKRLKIGVDMNRGRGGAIRRKVEHVDLRLGDSHGCNLIDATVGRWSESVGAVELRLRNRG